MSIPSILKAAQRQSDGFTATIPDDWLQGRTSYGGLSSALALHAAQGLADDLPPLRSANISFIGPLSGEVEVRARLLRRGRNASWAQAEITSEAGLGFSATFVFMGAMDSSLHLNHFPAPSAIAPEDAPLGSAMNLPGFIANNFEWRHGLAKRDAPKPEIARWFRLKDRSGLDPAVEVLAVADALPPGVLPLMTKAAPVSSMNWICNLLTPKPVTRDGWWLVHAWGNYAENGCSSQSMGVWNSDGEPVASGMQSIALFG